MSHETCLWLNRISIALAYCSFWFAAPEFIGQERLLLWQAHAKSFIGLMIACWGVVLAVLGFAIDVVPGTIALMKSMKANGFWRGLLLPPLTMPSLILGLFVLTGVALQRWGPTLVGALAVRSGWRKRSLLLAAFLFTLSCALQLASTIEKK
jgi:hypothetical protein